MILESALIPTLAGIDTDMIPFVAIVGGIGSGIIIVVSIVIADVSKTKRKQDTARELAAYVAEGSMTTDEAERIIRAADSKD